METTRILKSLDGLWRYARDPEDVGKSNRWQSGIALPGSIDLQVPREHVCQPSDYDGAAWYSRNVELDDAWPGKHVVLRFDAIQQGAEIWVNDKPAGPHDGGRAPLSLDVSNAIVVGENHIVVRIPLCNGSLAGNRSYSGIAGGVTLLARHSAHICDVFVQPDIRRKRVLATVTTSQPGTVKLRISETTCSAEGEPGRHVIEFPDFAFWSPEAPLRYTLECELLLDGTVVDSMPVRFGMREFTVKEHRFCLNHKPITIRGIRHGFGHPHFSQDPATSVRRELELAKAAGFNLVRFHLEPATSAALDMADELGLLVYEDLVGDSNLAALAQLEHELRAIISRDRNHPSLVIWGLRHLPDDVRDGLSKLSRELDPSRVILDGIRCFRPYRDDSELYDDLIIHQRGPVDREIALYFEHSGDPDRLSLLSEFGFGSIEDLSTAPAQDTSRSFDAESLQRMLDAVRPGFVERNLDRVFGDFSGFSTATRELQSRALKHQVEAMRLNGKLAGYCMDQLCDGEPTHGAGILDRWRRPKPVHAILKSMQAPLLPVILIPKTNLIPREEVHVSVSLVNDERSEARADLSLQVVGPTNQVLWKKKRNIKLPRGGKEIWSGTISASGSVGTHQFVVRIMQGHKVIAQNAVGIHVVEPVQACDVEVNLVDPNKEWRERCLRLAKAGESKAAVHVVPPLGNTVRAYPESELGHVLAEVRGGAVAIVFGPPDDWNEFAERVDETIKATSKDATGGPLGVYHYVKIHPVFNGLPARCIMGQPYRNVLPPKTFIETGDEDISGTLDLRPAQSGESVDASAWWGTDLLLRRYGSGRIVFTHLRVLENLGEDPVADCIFVNMLRHFSRRSIPSQETLPGPQEAIDWLRREKLHRLRQWMVIGMFPNWGGKGHETAYPPEKGADFSATYPGWYTAIEWKRWYSLADFGHCIDMQEAFSPVYAQMPRCDYGTGYAYAEFNSVARQAATIHLQVQNATKVWLNGMLVHESTEHLPDGRFADHRESVNLKQGRNIILVKVSKTPGEFRFSFDLESATRDPLHLTWWK
jgi:hypothetical protein